MNWLALLVLLWVEDPELIHRNAEGPAELGNPPGDISTSMLLLMIHRTATRSR